MSSGRVAVTGLGLVSPLGNTPDGFFQRLLAGESGIRLYCNDEGPQPIRMPAGRCVDFDADGVLGRSRAGTMDRYAQLGMAAALSAWEDAALPPRAESARPDWGVSWGTALGGEMTYERGYRELFIKGRTRVPPLAVVLGMNNAAASHIAIGLGLGGPCLTYTIACSSAAAAIGEAFRRVRSGEARIMLSGGSDSPLAYGVIRAWEALQVLAKGDEQSAPFCCRPFHSDRGGLVLAEGSSALVLEDWDHARARGARIHAEMLGYGCNADASHLVRPDQGGQARALRLALVDARADGGDIDYINAHGTATREGDPTEIAALREVFGAHAERLLVSSTKSAHGHLMGTAGAIEALATVLAVREGAVPPTLGALSAIDPACTGVRHVVGCGERAPVRCAISSSFAFGGSNAVLVFGAAE